jgi:hypothetical protein
MCKCWIKVDSESNLGYCDWLERNYQPSITCFRPVDKEKFFFMNDIMVNQVSKLTDVIHNFTIAFYKDVRNTPKFLKIFNQFNKKIEQQYRKSIKDFRKYLRKNKIRFIERYFIPKLFLEE